MFGSQQDPSKTEEATPKRRNKQREEGNVPKSQEASKCASIVGGLIGLSMLAAGMGEQLKEIFRYFLMNSMSFVPTEDSLYALAVNISFQLATILLPFMAVLLLGVFITLRLQVGKLWTWKVFQPKAERFNIIRNLKQMFFSPMTILRMLKSLGISCIIACIPAYYLYSEYQNFLPLYYASPEQVAVTLFDHAVTMTTYVLFPLLVIAGFDIWQTRYAYNENMKMSKDEIKDERKQQEGDEKVKAQQKQKMMQMATKRMMQDVPRADVVITNPTHYAVALSYDPLASPAPLVLAKGADFVAQKIKEIARENNVPIRENVSLARALYAACEVGDAIPEELYKATAAILANVWRLKGKSMKR